MVRTLSAICAQPSTSTPLPPSRFPKTSFRMLTSPTLKIQKFSYFQLNAPTKPQPINECKQYTHQQVSVKKPTLSFPLMKSMLTLDRSCLTKKNINYYNVILYCTKFLHIYIYIIIYIYIYIYMQHALFIEHLQIIISVSCLQ